MRTGATVVAAASLFSFVVAWAAEPAPSTPDPAATPACASAGTPGITARWSADGSVDPCGVRSGDPAPDAAEAIGADATIDRMTVDKGYYDYHYPGQGLQLLGLAREYLMSDGTSWEGGAGSSWDYYADLHHVEVDGTTVRYFLNPTSGYIFQNTDFDAGLYSAQGSLANDGLLVLEATIGSTTATMRGVAIVVSNDPTRYGVPRFKYYSAVPGSKVPFVLSYTLSGGTWGLNTFDTFFSYTNSGQVDFAHPISAPAFVEVSIAGTAQVPANTPAQFWAMARFENGFERPLTTSATWEAVPADLVSVNAGLLTVGDLRADNTPIVLRAGCTVSGVTRWGERTIRGRLRGSEQEKDIWPTFQADARHTGHVPQKYEPDTFEFRWSRMLGPSSVALKPAAAAEGRVFVSADGWYNTEPALYALDAQNGDTLWKQSFFNYPYSINPPAWAYGNVYVQTANHRTDTWLHAFNADTGAPVFKAGHEAQLVRYYAPTVLDGVAYVNGGYYGGMYAFDAFSGEQRWYAKLPQRDQWTPAVFGTQALAYVGGYPAGLYGVDRASGARTMFVVDPRYADDAWGMELAPLVLDNGDVAVIHNGRLLRFDVTGGTIAWECSDGFSGQPAYAAGVLYAVDGGIVAAVDAATGERLWSWSPPSGQPTGPMIVTDSHLLLSTDTAVYAVDLSTHETVWTYARPGQIALANASLYISSADGSITALSAEPYVPTPPSAVDVTGPDQVVEFSSAAFRAFVHYPDGRVRNRTLKAQWSVAPAGDAVIDATGILSVDEMLVLSQQIEVRATYTEAGVTVEGSKIVRLVVSVTLPEFVERNRLKAERVTRDAATALDEALKREEAILRALGSPSSPAPAKVDPFRQAIAAALAAGTSAQDAARRSASDLSKASQLPLPPPR